MKGTSGKGRLKPSKLKSEEKNNNRLSPPIPKKIIFYHNLLSRKLESDIKIRLGFTIFITVFIIGLKFILFPPFETPYLLALTAVIINALYAGFNYGLLSVIISTLLVNYLFIPPQYQFKFSSELLIQSIIYIGQGVLASFLIEKERQGRKKIYAQAEQLHVTLASIGDGVIATDVYGNILFMNKVAEDLTGWKSLEVVGRKSDLVFNIINEKTKRKIPNPVRLVLKRNKAIDLANHTILIKKDESLVPIDDSAAPIRDYQGNLIGSVLIFRDITQRRVIEKRKETFVSIASHELKTPITSIKLFLQLLKRKLENANNNEEIQILNKINNQVNKLSNLVNDLLDLSRIQAGKIKYRKEKTSLDTLIKESVEDLKQIYQDYNFILEGRIGKKIYFDNERIKQVLINLVSNGVRYSQNNKKIIITLEKNEQYAIVKITDFGIGIPKDEQRIIFNQFYQPVRTWLGTLYFLGNY